MRTATSRSSCRSEGRWKRRSRRGGGGQHSWAKGGAPPTGLSGPPPPNGRGAARGGSTGGSAPCDRHIGLGSLPRLLRPSLESFEAQPRALLAADAARAAAFRERLAGTGVRVIRISLRSVQPQTRGYVQAQTSAPLEGFMVLSGRDD